MSILSGVALLWDEELQEAAKKHPLHLKWQMILVGVKKYQDLADLKEGSHKHTAMLQGTVDAFQREADKLERGIWVDSIRAVGKAKRGG